MRVRRHSRRVRGAIAVENALVLPVLFTMVLGSFVAGFGVFRYQEIAYLAREGARWASVHGGQYAADTGNAAATATDVYNTAIRPKMNAVDAAHLTYSVTWNSNNFPYHTVINAGGNLVKVTNTVTVTVHYQWIPEALFGGGSISSTSVLPMSY